MRALPSLLAVGAAIVVPGIASAQSSDGPFPDIDIAISCAVDAGILHSALSDMRASGGDVSLDLIETAADLRDAFAGVMFLSGTAIDLTPDQVGDRAEGATDRQIAAFFNSGGVQNDGNVDALVDRVVECREAFGPEVMELGALLAAQ